MSNNLFKNNRELVLFTVLSAFVLAIYWQATGFGFINLDDNLYVYENPAVLSGLNPNTVKWAFSAFHSANWHPLTWLSHAADAQLFGRRAGGHHAVNIVFHLINTVLAFVVFRRLTRCFWKPAIVAALFAVHPAHVESVAWVAERKDVLSTLFWLLTMFAYLRYAEASSLKSQASSGDELKENESADQKIDAESFGIGKLRPKTKFYVLALVLFALGLMAKPMLVTLPFVLLLMDFWPLERLRNRKQLPALIIEKIPFFVLSGVSSYITILAQRASSAIQPLDLLPFDARLSNALVAYVKYIAMLFYPSNLAISYPYEHAIPGWQIGGALIVLSAITAFCLWQIRARKYLLTGWLWFLGTLVPVIGLVQVGAQSMADRYTYVPYFGLFVMLVWGAGELLKSKRAFFAVFAAAVLVFSVLSFRQTAFWKDNETLYRRALAVTRENFLISHNLCYTYTLENRLDEAEPLCRDALRFRPTFYDAYNTLGTLQIKRGQYAEAEKSFRTLIENVPDFTLAYANLSVAQALQKKPEQAEASLEKAVRLNSGQVANEVWIGALNNLAIVYNEQGKHEKAAENLTRILQIDPNNASARADLALTLNRLKRYDEAQKLIETALQLAPNEAAFYNIYGLILLEQNRAPEARTLFERALQLKPDYPEAKENLKKARGEK